MKIPISNYYKSIRFVLFIVLLVTIVVSTASREGHKGSDGISAKFTKYLAEEMEQSMLSTFLPVFAFSAQEGVSQNPQEMLCSLLLRKAPIYVYGIKSDTYALRTESEDMHEILLAEGRDEDVQKEAEALEEENLVHGLELENRAAGGTTGEETDPGTSSSEQNGLTAYGQGTFVKHAKMQEFDWEALKDYETLISTFYAIDSTTMVGSDQLNTEALLGRDMKISKEDPAPQILIYHTHSQEGFVDSVPGDASTTIVGAGDRLAQVLEEYGYSVLHHKGEYDVEARDQAYAKSLPALEQLLKENPSIEVVIDLHRDATAGDRKLVMDLDGRPTAQFMFFNGLSRTKKTGNIEYLYNENQADNLAFSFQMQVAAAEYYPGLTRKVYLKGYRYNMHLKPRTLLIELGSQNNTVEEIMNACDPIGHILDIVLSGTA